MFLSSGIMVLIGVAKKTLQNWGLCHHTVCAKVSKLQKVIKCCQSWFVYFVLAHKQSTLELGSRSWVVSILLGFAVNFGGTRWVLINWDILYFQEAIPVTIGELQLLEIDCMLGFQCLDSTRKPLEVLRFWTQRTHSNPTALQDDLRNVDVDQQKRPRGEQAEKSRSNRTFECKVTYCHHWTFTLHCCRWL